MKLPRVPILSRRTSQPRWVHNVFLVEEYSVVTGKHWRYWKGTDRDHFTRDRDKAGTWQSWEQADMAVRQYDLGLYRNIRIIEW